MDIETIKRRKEEIIGQHGPWTAHNMRLADGVFTMGPEPNGMESRAWQFMRMAADLCGKPVSELRALDLGALEGLYSIELAAQGARAVAVEAREEHVARARFAAEALGLSERVEVIHDDVRAISRQRCGAFDLTLCAGILYHLDTPDVFRLMRAIGEMTERVVIVDTHIALEAQEEREFEGRRYWGCRFSEHPPQATAEEKKRNPFASIDNVESFWLTRASLINLMSDCGFTSVVEAVFPPTYEQTRHRLAMIGVKGAPLKLKTTVINYDPASKRYAEAHEFSPKGDAPAAWWRRALRKLAG